MPASVIGLFITYGIVGFIHVCFRYIGLDSWKRATKPLLLPLLLAALLCWQYSYGFTLVGTLMSASLLCGWIGDIILLKEGNIRLVCGGIAFAIGHVFTISCAIYLLTQLKFFDPLAAVYFLTLAGVVVMASYYVMKDYHRANPDILANIGPYLAFYIILLSLMMLLVNTLPGQYHSPFLIIAALGALCFYMSDWTLLRAEFKGATNAFSGTWMLLYIIGQFGLAFGLYSFSLTII